MKYFMVAPLAQIRLEFEDLHTASTIYEKLTNLAMLYGTHHGIHANSIAFSALCFVTEVNARRGGGWSFLAWLPGWGCSNPDLSRRGGTGVTETAGAETIIRAHQLRQSDLIVEAEATVLKHLRDDNEGSRHQKMLLKLPGSNHTLLLAHNIDLAPRVPAEEGDAIRFRGEYEFSDKGWRDSLDAS